MAPLVSSQVRLRGDWRGLASAVSLAPCLAMDRS